MLQLQPVYTRGIGLFYIKIIVVVVKVIDDFNAKGIGVTKGAIINPLYVQVLVYRGVAPGFKNGIDLL